MIIIKLQGGLGNQLFQYAIGRTLEKRYKKEVKYDLSFYSNNKKFTPRSYLLDNFNTAVKIASDREINETRPIFSYLIKKIINKIFYKKYHIFYEPDFLESLKNKDSAYLEGYWQSFCYVEPYLEDLKKEITLKIAPSDLFKKMSDEVSGSGSTAIHIRRGDYVANGSSLVAVNISYYQKAIDFISEKTNKSRYYIFTDDVEWVKKNFNFLEGKSVAYVSSLGLNDYEELILMAQCSNFVIANSSFSWWGAILSQNKDATIICPKDWKNIYLKNDENLCPKEWVRI